MGARLSTRKNHLNFEMQLSGSMIQQYWFTIKSINATKDGEKWKPNGIDGFFIKLKEKKKRRNEETQMKESVKEMLNNSAEDKWRSNFQ